MKRIFLLATLVLLTGCRGVHHHSVTVCLKTEVKPQDWAAKPIAVDVAYKLDYGPPAPPSTPSQPVATKK